LGAITTRLKNETDAQVQKVLSTSNIAENVLQGTLEDLQKLFVEEDENCTFVTTNGIFAQEGFEFQETFKREVGEKYKFNLQNLDFKSTGNSAKQEVNHWLRRRYSCDVPALLNEDEVNPLIPLLLVCATQFKGSWKNKFLAKKTQPKPFHVTEEESIDVDMMYQVGKFEFGYNKDLDTHAIELPYLGDNFSMYVLLTNPKHKLKDLESKLTVEALANPRKVFSMKAHDTVGITLPKFTFQCSQELVEPLRSMGVTDLFDENRADLSEVIKGKSHFVSQFIHQAVLEVNEEGRRIEKFPTKRLSEKRRVTPIFIPFTADHPFLFFIQDKRSGTPLFVGRYVRPID